MFSESNEYAMEMATELGRRVNTACRVVREPIELSKLHRFCAEVKLMRAAVAHRMSRVLTRGVIPTNSGLKPIDMTVPKDSKEQQEKWLKLVKAADSTALNALEHCALSLCANLVPKVLERTSEEELEVLLIKARDGGGLPSRVMGTLEGLQQMDAYNGCSAEVHEFVADRQRYQVRLDFEGAEKWLCVRPQNISLMGLSSVARRQVAAWFLIHNVQQLSLLLSLPQHYAALKRCAGPSALIQVPLILMRTRCQLDQFICVRPNARAHWDSNPQAFTFGDPLLDPDCLREAFDLIIAATNVGRRGEPMMVELALHAASFGLRYGSLPSSQLRRWASDIAREEKEVDRGLFGARCGFTMACSFAVESAAERATSDVTPTIGFRMDRIPDWNARLNPSYVAFEQITRDRPGKDSACAYCQQPSSTLKRCGGCRKVKYCCVACAKAAWPKHKAVCSSSK